MYPNNFTEGKKNRIPNHNLVANSQYFSQMGMS